MATRPLTIALFTASRCLRQRAIRPQTQFRCLAYTTVRNTRSPYAEDFSDSLQPQPDVLDPLGHRRAEEARRAYYKRRSYYAGAGAVICTAATLLLISTYDLNPKPTQLDSPNAADFGKTERRDPLVAGNGDDVEQVPTGTSSVPYFPKTLHLPSGTSSSKSAALPAGTGDVNDEYHLLGLGIRTVSFLGIQVYVVGLYVAISDIASLQARLVKEGASMETASALVSTEKDALKNRLLDPVESMRVWNEVLKDSEVRSVVRIVPTRNTDFAHLRDGWVRGITARSQKGAVGIEESFEDEEFGQAVGEFKKMFSGASRKKGLAKGKVLLLEREGSGVLSAWVEGESAKEEGERKGGKGEMVKIGEVRDERVSRLVWLGYLGGKTVASEGARQSVVDGLMDIVERPVGSVETMVV
jgi:hypothetical protein